MKLRTLTLLLSCSMAHFTANAQILQQFISKIKSYKNVSYTDVATSQMSFDVTPYTDTVKNYITNIPGEPQIGGYYEAKGRSTISLYDGRQLVDLSIADTTYSLSDKAVTGQNSRTLLYYTHDLIKLMQTPSKIKQLPDTIIAKVPYAHILITAYDSIEQKQHTYTLTELIINKKTMLPYAIKDKVRGMGEDGSVGGWVEEHVYNDFRFNEKNFPDLTVITIPANFKLPVKSKPVAFLPNGTKAPDIKLYDLAGKPVDLQRFIGKPVLLNFTWIGCPHCGGATEMLNTLYEKYKNTDVAIVSIYPLDNKDQVLKYEKKMDVRFQSLTADKAVKSVYSYSGYPTFYLLDKQGVINQSYEGFYKELESQLTEKIDQLVR